MAGGGTTQTWLLLLGFAELFLCLCVFVAPPSLEGHRTVSSNLFALDFFRALLTLLVGAQLVFSALYLLRFRVCDRVWAWAGVFFVVAAGLGWVILVSYAPNHGEHLVGTAIFMLATGVYFSVLLRLAFEHDAAGNFGYDMFTGLYLLSLLGLEIALVAVYFADNGKTWLVENTALLGMVGGYIVFFLYHPFSPCEVIPPSTREAVIMETPAQCRPLLVPQRAQA
jgi:hypothetical protein